MVVTYAKAFCIASVIYTFDPKEGIEEHEDRLYRTVDKLLHLTDEQKAEFYAHLSEKLDRHTPIIDATAIILSKLRSIVYGRLHSPQGY